MVKQKNVVISLSGGMDSSTLLIHSLAQGFNVTAVSFDYGQKHRVELDRAQSLVDYLCESDIEIANNLKYRVIKLDGLPDLLNSALVSGGEEVPEGHYAEENMKATVVPNRNKIFSSIIQAIALSMYKANNLPTYIGMGIHAGDHAIYPDCRTEFRDADLATFKLGNWDADDIEYYTPYINSDKFKILKDGILSCFTLGIDFDEVYSRTNTSYKPIKIDNKWYSDYKSASSVERIEAFIHLGKADPVEYADETGPVTWFTARNHVEDLLLNRINGKSTQRKVYYFYSKTCGLCNWVSDKMKELSNNYPIFRINSNEELLLSDLLNIDQIPTFVFIEDGKEVNRIIGLKDPKNAESTYEEIENFVK